MSDHLQAIMPGNSFAKIKAAQAICETKNFRHKFYPLAVTGEEGDEGHYVTIDDHVVFIVDEPAPDKGNSGKPPPSGISDGKDKEHVVLNGHKVERTTEKAILVSHPDLGQTWLPKSQIEEKPDGSIEMKSWLADKFQSANHTFEPEFPVKETASGKAYQMKVSVNRIDGEPREATIFLPKSQVTYDAEKNKMTAPKWLLDAKEADAIDRSSGDSHLTY